MSRAARHRNAILRVRVFTLKKTIQILSLFGLLAASANAVFATAIIIPPTITEYFTKYTFDLDTHSGLNGYETGFGPNLYRMVLFEDDTVSAGSDGTGFAAYDQPGNVIQSGTPFLGALPSQALMIGLVDNLPGDPSEITTTHVVFLMSDGAAALAAGQAFDTVFTAPLADGSTVLTEQQLINALIDATNGGATGLATLTDFTNTTARNLSGTGGPASAWFDFGGTSGGTFSVVAFSGGASLGTGVTGFDSQEIANTATPEPGTWVMLAAGLGVLLYSRRRTA